MPKICIQIFFFIFLWYFEKTWGSNFFFEKIFFFFDFPTFQGEHIRQWMSQRNMSFSPIFGRFKFFDPPKSVKEDEFGYSSFTRNDPRQKLENRKEKKIDRPVFSKNWKNMKKKKIAIFWPILVKLRVYFWFLVKLVQYRAQIAQNPLK